MRGRQTRGIRKPQTPPLTLRAQSIEENLPHTQQAGHTAFYGKPPHPHPCKGQVPRQHSEGTGGAWGPGHLRPRAPPEYRERSPGVMKVDND